MTLLAAMMALRSADRVTDLVQSEMRRAGLPAVCLVVSRNGKVVRRGAYGGLVAGSAVRCRYDDRFPVGELTRGFVAFALLKLADERRLSLDDPVGKWLPDAPEGWRAITVRQVSRHTSGLPDYHRIVGLTSADVASWTAWSARVGAEIPAPEFAPGTAGLPSPTNDALLGFLVERVAGRPLAEAVRARVFAPFGFEDTRWLASGGTVARMAKGHALAEGKAGDPPAPPVVTPGESGVVSSCRDLARWDRVIRLRKGLRAGSYREMLSPTRLASGRARPWGIGWNLDSFGMPSYSGASGSAGGFGAGIARYAKGGLTVAVLTNGQPYPAEGLARAIAETLDPALKPVRLVERRDPDPARTARVRDALVALAGETPDPELLEPELLATMAATKGRPSALKGLEGLVFCSETPDGADRRLAYRATAGGRALQVWVVWTPSGRAAQVVVRRA